MTSSKLTADLFGQHLLKWYDLSGRKDLPWQQNINPYRVWISEIMLQQTQVMTVIPYYKKFMQTFPDVSTLANANIDQVLHLWTGLGYYSRARNLHKSAKIIVDEFGGELPDNLDDMMRLPGIGRSTAGAILAIAQQKRFAIMDGNVKRVLTRLHAIDGWPGAREVNDELWRIAEEYTPKNRVGDYTQAIMDFGATLCTRSKPNCAQCPVQTFCLGYRSGTPTSYPRKKAKKIIPIKSTVFMMIRTNDRSVLLERRPPVGIWGGLYCFIQCDQLDHVSTYCWNELGLKVESVLTTDSFRHTFSHFHLDIQPVVVQVSSNKSKMMDSDKYFWYKLGEINTCGLAAPVKKLIQQLETEVTT